MTDAFKDGRVSAEKNRGTLVSEQLIGYQVKKECDAVDFCVQISTAQTREANLTCSLWT